jgi:hypothetical protein
VTIPLDEIMEVSRSVAAEHSPRLEVLGVVSTEGGSNRVEVLITIAGCLTDSCRLIINLSRAEESELKAQLRQKFRAALQQHVAQ